MLTAGDELGHTQGGNNNAYCQDNPISWIDWSAADEALIDFCARVIAVRKSLMPLANRWYTGLTDKRGVQDLTWTRSDGAALTQGDWRDPAIRAIGAVIGAPGHSELPLLLLTNGEPHDIAFTLPKGHWRALIDTATASAPDPADLRSGSFLVVSRSLVLLQQSAPTPTAAPTR
jgi:glycogen debranching enzyme